MIEQNETAEKANVSKSAVQPIVMRNHGGMREAVKSLSEYWATYFNQECYEKYSLDTLLNDCLYGIGIAISPDEYSFAPGYWKFKEDLRTWLEHA